MGVQFLGKKGYVTLEWPLIANLPWTLMFLKTLRIMVTYCPSAISEEKLPVSPTFYNIALNYLVHLCARQ